VSIVKTWCHVLASRVHFPFKYRVDLCCDKLCYFYCFFFRSGSNLDFFGHIIKMANKLQMKKCLTSISGYDEIFLPIVFNSFYAVSEKIIFKWFFAECSIFSNGSHLGWRAGLSDTFLKGDHQSLVQIGPVVLEELIKTTKIATVTKNRKFSKKSLKNYLLWNCWANLAQTMVEWSSDGPFWELCPTTLATNQDSRCY
jgi:hypothetical protein